MNERLTENFATHCCLFRNVIPCELRAIIQTYRSFNATTFSHDGSPTTSSSACRQIVKDMTQVTGSSRGVDNLHDIGDLLDLLMDLPTFESLLAYSNYRGRYPFSDSRSLGVRRDVLNKLNDTQLDIVLEVLEIDGYTLFRSLSPLERIYKYHERYRSKILRINFANAISNNEFLDREERKKMMADILTGRYR